ncbi:hypothetical protein A2V56_04420 [Candidatus Woesebacteria bacterium RBG_19FT_COMBO_42_9]|uniref:Uncharacterized protein n=1 Tax=Candidatus Woesebacteria bacterium RBG_16_42_24 TaxID=1802485 RepID=A0A1F7XMF7_9BACT|nr:MAG: hypothetical protein A2V97_04405 [Candidatus Woesebacteria bacterium RBG_16_42_24]OGM16210.1 MAG: hypothetical protein A2V56_04420 [Candidatus Woesebacteria bacterium RBG_19FT_COMBO_42_9]OGM68507.1 MAG: hypothetical protein A2985_04025 [Candidatus Woesebacteria bacterium RIFCSPLOWO2_01_FULL_43_11]
MLGKTLGKIDRFYPILVIVLIALSVLVFFSLRSVFNGLTNASEFDLGVAPSNTKINEKNLNEAYKEVSEKPVLKFDLAQ